MLLDLVYAARTLGRGRVLAVVAVATIALGIGASTAVFTVAEAVLLRPLPYRAADRPVVATVEMRQRNVVELPFSSPDLFTCVVAPRPCSRTSPPCKPDVR